MQTRRLAPCETCGRAGSAGLRRADAPGRGEGSVRDRGGRVVRDPGVDERLADQVVDAAVVVAYDVEPLAVVVPNRSDERPVLLRCELVHARPAVDLADHDLAAVPGEGERRVTPVPHTQDLVDR